MTRSQTVAGSHLAWRHLNRCLFFFFFFGGGGGVSLLVPMMPGVIGLAKCQAFPAA